MSKVLELFGRSTSMRDDKWAAIVKEQLCPFTCKTCFKIRKSDPSISIGTCSVLYGKEKYPVIICPNRLTDKHQIFTDCLHLLTTHEPGNELHIVQEVTIPGGSVDYFLVSVKGGAIKDFVGIELQTLDTTGTVWPERQRLLKDFGLSVTGRDECSSKSFGMNWKMTAKTILVQMHHKIHTFEHVNKRLVLIVQDNLLEYMCREFDFGHLREPAVLGDTMHFHSYQMRQNADRHYGISLASRLSTDSDGIGRCLGLQAEAKIELEQIIESLRSKISASTLFSPI